MITGQITLSNTNIGQQIGSQGQVFGAIQFYGYSGFNITGVPVVNQNSIYLGPISGHYPIEVPAGSSVGLTMPNKFKEGLKNYFAIGSSGDGLYYIGW